MWHIKPLVNTFSSPNFELEKWGIARSLIGSGVTWSCFTSSRGGLRKLALIFKPIRCKIHNKRHLHLPHLAQLPGIYLKSSNISLHFLHTVLLHFLRSWQGEIAQQSKVSWFGDHFLYSPALNVFLEVILWGEISCVTLGGRNVKNYPKIFRISMHKGLQTALFV